MMTKMLQTANKTYIVQTRFLFHCHIKVKIPASYPEALLEDCFALLEAIDTRYNSYQNDSFFSRINKYVGSWVTVDEVTIDLLKQALQISALTEGSYDVTSMPLIHLWGFYQEKPSQIPSKEAIENCLKYVNYQRIQIDENRVKIDKDQELITGSFIKAYAVDQVMTMLQDQGITDALVNAGGSSIFALSDDTHPQWNICIPHPENDTVLARVPLQNECFSLSASKHQFLEIDGKRYSHILNAKTGFPSQNLQVGLISASACLGDMLSTALFGLEASQFETTVLRLKKNFDFEVYLIDDEMKSHKQHFKFPIAL